MKLEIIKKKGIYMYGIVRVLLSQCADDTMLFLSYDKVTLEAVIDTLELIQNNMGLKGNYDKRCLHRIGSIANSQAKLFTKKEFTW